jgi:hypothetical protein
VAIPEYDRQGQFRGCEIAIQFCLQPDDAARTQIIEEEQTYNQPCGGPANMSVSLRTRLNTELGANLPSPLIAVSPAWLGMKGVFLWAAAGAIGGTLLDLVLKTGLESLVVGVGVSVGLAVGLHLKDRNAREDPSLPGGLYVMLGATSDDLVVISRSLWSMKDLKVEAREPFSNIVSVHVESKFWPAVTVTFGLADGKSWRYKVNRWRDLQPRLPQRLFDPQSS